MWKIVVFMAMSFSADQEMYPLTMDNEKDVIVITHYQAKPLNFKTEESCYSYMWENVDAIKAYASFRFNGKPVKQIICVNHSEA